MLRVKRQLGVCCFHLKFSALDEIHWVEYDIGAQPFSTPFQERGHPFLRYGAVPQDIPNIAGGEGQRLRVLDFLVLNNLIPQTLMNCLYYFYAAGILQRTSQRPLKRLPLFRRGQRWLCTEYRIDEFLMELVRFFRIEQSIICLLYTSPSPRD